MIRCKIPSTLKTEVCDPQDVLTDALAMATAHAHYRAYVPVPTPLPTIYR